MNACGILNFKEAASANDLATSEVIAPRRDRSPWNSVDALQEVSPQRLAQREAVSGRIFQRRRLGLAPPDATHDHRQLRIPAVVLPAYVPPMRNG